jgi:hypothetical protein
LKLNQLLLCLKGSTFLEQLEHFADTCHLYTAHFIASITNTASPLMQLGQRGLSRGVELHVLTACAVDSVPLARSTNRRG